MNWRYMMETARLLAGQAQPTAPGRPRQEPLKRAVSTAYYAMFHALCRSNANSVTNRRAGPASQRAWDRTYRALDHRQAKNRLLQVRQDLPHNAQLFATTFSLLLTQREAADYNPHSKFSRIHTINLIDIPEEATGQYMQLSPNQRRAIAALTLLQDRPQV